MEIWKHKSGGNWWNYWKPVWLNSITWKKGEPKIYRWLFWGYYFKKDLEN